MGKLYRFRTERGRIERSIDAEPRVGADFVSADPELSAAFEVCIVLDESTIGGQLSWGFEFFAMCRAFEVDEGSFDEIEEWRMTDGGESPFCGVEKLG